MTTTLTVLGIEGGAKEAEKVVVSWKASASALLDACERIHEVMTVYKDDKDELERFIEGLVRGRVITPNEGLRGVKSPQLSKLRTIGEKARMLREAQLERLLPPDYSTVYQLCVLDKQLAENVADDQARLEKLKGIVEAAPEVSRQFFASETKKAKDKNQPVAATKAKHAPEDARIASQPVDGGTSVTRAEVLEAGQTFDLILMTPDKEKLSILSRDGAEEVFETAFPVSRICAEENGAVVVVLPLSSLWIVTERLLPACDLGRRSLHVLLPRTPARPEITDETVIAVAYRGGKMDLDAFSALGWKQDGDSECSSDSRRTAETVFPGRRHKLHVFGDGSRGADGWVCLEDAG